MTRKDYVLIAEAISETYSDKYSYGAIREVASRLASKLAADNPRFDAERFVKACGF